MNEPSDIGVLLCETRCGFGWSLEDVAHRTRIPVAVLRQLEENDFEKFPSRSYAKSFLAQYSEHLGIDAIEWLERFETDDALANLDRHEYLKEQDECIKAAPLVLERRRPKKLKVRPELRDEKPERRLHSAAAQPLLVFTVSSGLIAAAVFGFMKLSENFSGQSPDSGLETTRDEPLAPLSSINVSRPRLPSFSSAPRALPVTSEDSLFAGHPSTARRPEARNATPANHKVTLSDFSFDNPPPRAVIVEE